MFCLQLVVLLVDHGANINQKNKRGKTPQDVAGVDLNRFLRCWKASGLFFQILIIVCMLVRVTSISDRLVTFVLGSLDSEQQ